MDTEEFLILGYTELARYSDAYHQRHGPIMAKPNDSGAIFDPDLASCHWLTQEMKGKE